jgi:hypothetical protein
MLMWLLWAPLGIALGIIYMVAYVLLRTSGDGRAWYERLRHPSGGQ